MSKIYVATSWRNDYQPGVVQILRDAGHEVYDFRHPAEDDDGFSWLEIDPKWQTWTRKEFMDALYTPAATRGFQLDMDALRWAEVVVLVMPCGRSAHLELGYAVGAEKPTAILLENGEPELMYKMVDYLAESTAQLLVWLESLMEENNNG